jgi:hypothetical protein
MPATWQRQVRAILNSDQDRQALPLGSGGLHQTSKSRRAGGGEARVRRPAGFRAGQAVVPPVDARAGGRFAGQRPFALRARRRRRRRSTERRLQHGVPLVWRLIADAARDPSSIPALEQDLSRRRYFGREVPNGGNIVWSAAARQIVRFVRAADYSPFASPWGIPLAQLDGQPVGIAKAPLTGEHGRAAGHRRSRRRD